MMKCNIPSHPLLKIAIFFTLLFLILIIRNIYLEYCSYKNVHYSHSLLQQEIETLNQQIAASSQFLSTLQSRIQNSSLLNKYSHFFDNNDVRSLTKATNISPSEFQDGLRKRIAAFKDKAREQNILFPENFFLGFNQYEAHLPTTEEIGKCQQQETLLALIAEELLLFPNLKIEQFDLQEVNKNQQESSLLIPLGSLLITVTTDELSFQKLFNNLINHAYFFLIETLSIVNSQPNQPLHLSNEEMLLTKESIYPLLGREKITATLKIQLITISPPGLSYLSYESNHKKELTNSSTINNKLFWKRNKNQSPLFVSRHYAIKNGTLIDLLEDPNMLYPPVPNEWLITNNLDYGDPNILSEDTDQDGFTNLEEWLGNNPIQEPGKFSSNPNDPASHPLLWTKLVCHRNDIKTTCYPLYFTGYNDDKNEKIFHLQPENNIPNTDRNNIIILNKKPRYVKIGEQLAGLPLKVLSYKEEKTIYKDITYDTSSLILLNTETQEQWPVVKKSTIHPQPTIITTRDAIRFHNNLFSPPKVIEVKCGASFSLESLAKNKNLKNTSTERYQVAAINTDDVVLKKDNKEYHVPVISGKCPDSFF